jgi:hypothetical protein
MLAALVSISQSFVKRIPRVHFRGCWLGVLVENLLRRGAQFPSRIVNVTPWRILLCVTEYLQGQVFGFLSAL